MTGLTLRQRQVLTLAAYGNTNIQIGRVLEIAPNTVNRHLVEAYAALGAHDRANAVALAIHGGDISLAELGRIAAAASERGVVAPPAAPGGAVSASRPVGGGRDVRGAARGAESRSADPGEAAA
ncbi:helix-turn-helix transcriptional regulator [Streptomyces sp.]|uniref:helix-turn-helix domain-containing protein n=1 Tax=Streptomyces sp. TaxID=1931 RepID=UPI002F93EEDE